MNETALAVRPPDEGAPLLVMLLPLILLLAVIGLLFTLRAPVAIVMWFVVNSVLLVQAASSAFARVPNLVHWAQPDVALARRRLVSQAEKMLRPAAMPAT